jgi:DNA-binding transcriptional LysR family regulator
MDLSIGKLHQLIMVARARSFSKAAMVLNISQPALSRAIAAIEDHYGFQIFNRMGHGVQLTAVGAQVIAQAEPLLQTMRVFDNNLGLFGSGKAGRLQLGLAPLLASQFLAKFAGEFFTSDTKAQLQVLIRSGSELLEELKNHAIELFFFPESYIEPAPEIDIEPLGHIAAALTVRKDHPLCQREHLSLSDLSDFAWASAINPPQALDTMSPARFICDNYHILRDAVLSSDLICICSLAFVADQLAEGTLKTLEVEGLPLPPTQIYVAKLNGRVNSPLAEEAVARMRKYLTV